MADTAKLSQPAGIEVPRLGEPFLLTPGPLTTAFEVKEAMLKDWGSWDQDFRDITAEVRHRLLGLIGDTVEPYDCVPIQGSGTFCVEAMLGTFLPKESKTLVLVNGAYGKRIVETLKYMGCDHLVIDKGDFLPPRASDVLSAIDRDQSISHVVAVHCETSSGILNPIEEIAGAVHQTGRKFLIDSMSAFGAIDLDPDKVPYEAMVSSANKCIEGVPGFGFVIAKESALQASKGNCHSLSLDAEAQWRHMNKTGQWRFTPPTHVVAAFLEALRRHEEEGGVSGRGARYEDNRDVLVNGMRALGFETLLDKRWLSPIIVTFFNPVDANFQFERFYELMKRKGFIIYPGKLTEVDSFRVGCIGQMDAAVMRDVVRAAAESLDEMGVDTAAPGPKALAERAKLVEQDAA